MRRGGLCSRALGVVAGGRGLPGGVPAVSSSLSPPPVGCGVSARLAGDASFHFPYQLVDYQSSDATFLCFLCFRMTPNRLICRVVRCAPYYVCVALRANVASRIGN